MREGYGIHVPYLTPINKLILIVCGSLFIVQSILSQAAKISLSSIFGLTVAQAINGHLYQFLTYPLFQSSFITFLFNALILWFIGSDLELNWRRNFYISFLVVSVLGAGLTHFLVTITFFSENLAFFTPMVGITGICYSLLLMYGLLYGDRILSLMLIFPIKARYFCWILIAIELYIGFFSPHASSSWGHLGGMLFSFIFYRYKFNMPLFKFKKRVKRKDHLHLVKDDDDDENNSDVGPRYWQ